MPTARPFAIPEEEFAEDYVRPSSGPGGQHQNKTENGVRLQWNVAETAVLTEAQKTRLRALAVQYMQGDLLVVMERSSRSLARNRERARERIRELALAALPEPRKRRPTKPTKASQERRLKAKAVRSRIKALRSGGSTD
ncbi:MAG: alternative ribosome rescue aminoacyl-tRNA hydrolase ArfB [Lentisphaeria bacterium]|nr:alternative ribosome rescue aminoacyl-tRNA hydrolase ArfB [Lentisphaeria bacterium]